MYLHRTKGPKLTFNTGVCFTNIACNRPAISIKHTVRRVVSQQRMKFEPFELSSNTAADWTNAEMDVETISVETSALRRNSINRRVFAGCVQKRIACGELLVHTMVTSVKPKRTASFANPNGLRSNLATRYFRRITYKIHALASFKCNCVT